jgi:hypothetical protein
VRGIRVTRWVVALCGLMIGTAHAQAPADLQRAIESRQKALETGDLDTWDRFTAFEYTRVDQFGRLQAKVERLAELKQRQPPGAPVMPSRAHIQVYADAAVQRVESGKIWVLQVWIRTTRGWQVIATQLTAVR